MSYTLLHSTLQDTPITDIRVLAREAVQLAERLERVGDVEAAAACLESAALLCAQARIAASNQKGASL